MNRFAFVATLFCLVSVAAWAEAEKHAFEFPADAGVTNVRDPAYGAKGDGITDDTLAFQKVFLEEPVNALIYVPDGTYLISDTISWGKNQKRQILQGQSEAGTVIRLMDQAPGFRDPANAKPMIWTGKAPAQRFRNGIRNITIDSGKDNPGAIPVQFIANNQGGMERVTIRHSDGPGGGGPIGLDLGYTDEQGPCFITHVTVIGFDVGVYTRGIVDSITFEDLNLREQNHVGFRNDGQVVNIRQLTSRNAVPAYENLGDPSLTTLLDSRLFGTDDAAGPAIVNEAGLFVRNLTVEGYDQAIANTGGHGRDPSGVRLDEWTSHEVLSLFPSPPKSLGLAVEETPLIPLDKPADWVSVTRYGPPEMVELTRLKDGKRFQEENWAPALQKAIDAGATTVYFPPLAQGEYGLYGEIHLRNKLRRIIGMEASLGVLTRTNESHTAFDEKFTPTFILDPGEAPAVVVERFNTWYSSPVFIQNSDRALVIRNMSIYKAVTNGGGDVFLEDVRAKKIQVNGGRLFGRQVNPEGWEMPRIEVNGGDAWFFGLKTETDATIAEVNAGGRLEILGAFVYANKDKLETKQMFINRGGMLSATVGEWVIRKAPFDILEETRDGETRRLNKGEAYSRGGGAMFPLLVSYTLPASTKPAAPSGLKAQPRGTDGVALQWDALPGAKGASGLQVRVRDVQGNVAAQTLLSADRREVTVGGLQAGQTYEALVIAFNGAGESEPAKASVSVPAGAPPSNGTGLSATYFKDPFLAKPAGTATDPTIDFAWAGNSPGHGVESDAFSVRWTGELEPRFSETYTFRAEANDGLRMWLGDELLIDQWDFRRRAATARVDLEAGKRVPIRVEYVKRGGKAAVKLEWKSTNESDMGPIPAAQLHPTTLTLPNVSLEGGRGDVAFDANSQTLTITVDRSGSSDQALSVKLVGSGEASAGLHYELPAASEIPAGQTQVQAAVSFPHDRPMGKDKTLIVEVMPQAGYFAAGKPIELVLRGPTLPHTGQGTGLTGRYYADEQTTNLTVERVDPTIDYVWDKKPPAKGMPKVDYRIQWRGELLPRFTEEYTIDADLGKYGKARVIIGDQTVIDAWDDRAQQPTTGTVRLEAGRRYPIMVEYANTRDYGSKLRLFWSSASQFHEIIPAPQLFPQ